MRELNERVQKEFENFKKDVIENNSPTDVFEMAYHICWKKEILDAVKNVSLSEKRLKSLESVRGNLLEVLYDEWLSNSGTSVDDVYDMIEDFADELYEEEK